MEQKTKSLFYVRMRHPYFQNIDYKSFQYLYWFEERVEKRIFLGATVHKSLESKLKYKLGKSSFY